MSPAALSPKPCPATLCNSVKTTRLHHMEHKAVLHNPGHLIQHDNLVRGSRVMYGNLVRGSRVLYGSMCFDSSPIAVCLLQPHPGAAGLGPGQPDGLRIQLLHDHWLLLQILCNGYGWQPDTACRHHFRFDIPPRPALTRYNQTLGAAGRCEESNLHLFKSGGPLLSGQALWKGLTNTVRT